jgi:hypothetical protein
MRAVAIAGNHFNALVELYLAFDDSKRRYALPPGEAKVLAQIAIEFCWPLYPAVRQSPPSPAAVITWSRKHLPWRSLRRRKISF